MHEFQEAMQSRLASGRAYMAVQLQDQNVWDWGKRNGLQSIKKDKKKKKSRETVSQKPVKHLMQDARVIQRNCTSQQHIRG